jgi:peptidoglycan/LPS O-acetylase OafA/YrhL
VTTTLTTIAFVLATTVLAGILVWHHLEERSRRRDREIVRRIHTYLAQLPPTRPW